MMEVKLPYGEPQSVISSTECTGLIQDINTDDQQTESYREIYNIPLKPVEIPVKKRPSRRKDDVFVCSDGK